MFLCGNVMAQSPMERFLESIARNNKSLKTSRGQVEADNIRQKTGIFLPNPTIEYKYMTGEPSEFGNKTDFGVTQSFDFPSVYILQNKIAGLHGNANQFILLGKRQDILRKAAELYTCLLYTSPSPRDS